MQAPRYSLHHQSGMVLIVSFIILLLLTIIGVSGLKVTGLEEKMAGNDRDQSAAFQAAETALRTAEAQTLELYDGDNLQSFCSGGSGDGLFFSPSVEYCDPPCPATPTGDCAVPNPMDSAIWVDANSVEVDTSHVAPGSEGRYFVVFHYYYPAPKSAGKQYAYYNFTITARGVGAQGGETILRSYFGAKVCEQECGS